MPQIQMNPELIGKVTAILIDKETFTTNEILENLQNTQNLKTHVDEAIELIQGK